MVWKLEFRFFNFGKDLSLICASKRENPSQQNIGNDPNTPKIRFLHFPAFPGSGALWRQIMQSANHSFVHFSVLHNIAIAKINQLEHSIVAFPVKQHIIELQIAMHNITFVHISHCRDYDSDILARLFFGKLFPRGNFIQKCAAFAIRRRNIKTRRSLIRATEIHHVLVLFQQFQELNLFRKQEFVDMSRFRHFFESILSTVIAY
mmetsp:Transcript_6146/g.9740  ORF Transcript_6146/g.9740 Transcript_6146/m.9740 type:complete len:205 (+) Transcript_6146:726-1340(+)